MAGHVPTKSSALQMARSFLSPIEYSISLFPQRLGAFAVSIKLTRMKVTQVALRPTATSEQAGRPSLTPELLAASGARYSRSDEGLEAILAKIDPNNLDKSVDSIFKMIDYGHQSIADMVPVAIFMDGVSLWLAYYMWSICPTAGGQESSTRYINYQSVKELRAGDFGIAETHRDEWETNVRDAFECYEKSLKIWEEIAQREPNVMRLPSALINDSSERAQKQIARMRRNYAFDRARYFLPICAPTNMMMIQSARAWTGLCQHLLSHFSPEAQQLGARIREELELAAPRMTKHAEAKTSICHGLQSEWGKLQQMAQAPREHLRGNGETEHPPRAFLHVDLPPHVTENDIAESLQFHDNRYAWLGSALQRSSTRFGWEAVSFAEIRDLNRHRTGTKWCPPVPQGFYSALDQLPPQFASDFGDKLRALNERGKATSRRALELLRDGENSYVYSLLLGTQFPFEHTTTADKFIYEAELRTGTGAHYRYAQHLHDVLELWYQKFPSTRGLVLEGSAEPE